MPIAAEALTRIGALYAIEADLRGRPPEQRQVARQARAGPLLDDLHQWLQTTLTMVSKKSELAVAVRYALARWTALTRYRDNGGIEIGRVGNWRGGGRLGLSVAAPCVWRGRVPGRGVEA